MAGLLLLGPLEPPELEPVKCRAYRPVFTSSTQTRVCSREKNIFFLLSFCRYLLKSGIFKICFMLAVALKCKCVFLGVFKTKLQLGEAEAVLNLGNNI